MKCQKCNYDNTDEDALYCGLCYEPLKKSAGNGAAEAAPDEAVKAEAMPILQIALIAGLLSGAAVYFYGASAPAAGREPSQLETIRLQEKITDAEKLLAAYTLGRAGLIAEISAGEIDPEGFGPDGQYTKKLFKLEEDYVNSISAVQPDCRKYAGEANNAACLKWSEDYGAKETLALESFNEKYRQLARKAGSQ